MKTNSAIRQLYDPQEIPLSLQYHTLAKNTYKLEDDFCKDLDSAKKDSFYAVLEALIEQHYEASALTYAEGFKLGLALGFESGNTRQLT